VVHVNRGRDPPGFCPNLQVLDMLLSAVSVLVVAQPSSEVPEGLMNYTAYVIPNVGSNLKGPNV
jgi:hypothetical protein